VGPTKVPIGSQRGPQPKNPFLPSKWVKLRDFWAHHTGDTSKGSQMPQDMRQVEIAVFEGSMLNSSVRVSAYGTPQQGGVSFS
jgi:hypothetical protein